MLRPTWCKLINCLYRILSGKTQKSNLLPAELLQIPHTYFIRFLAQYICSLSLVLLIIITLPLPSLYGSLLILIVCSSHKSLPF
jgi:hypothetical protein